MCISADYCTTSVQFFNRVDLVIDVIRCAIWAALLEAASEGIVFERDPGTAIGQSDARHAILEIPAKLRRTGSIGLAESVAVCIM